MIDAPILRISEIFYSLQGETSTVGKPTVFVRLTGCPLRCQYCDTSYAFSGGELMSLDLIMARVNELDCPFVTVTGGEPLAQGECLLLLSALCDAGLSVSLETSGALSIANVDERVCTVMDIKTPGSLEVARNLDSNIALLKSGDQVKFVLCDRKDYEWAKSRVMQLNLIARVAEVLFSPSYHQLDPRELAEWILHDRLRVRMQMQMHKLIWGDKPGH